MKRILHIREKRGTLRRLDWYLIVNLLFIFGVGIMNLISATSSFYSGALPFVAKQITAFLIGSLLAVAILKLDYRGVAEKADWIYWITTIFTFVVLIYGTAKQGSTRWIVLPGGISFQPSEFVKPALVLLLAHKLHAMKNANMRLSLKSVIKPLLYTIIPVGLVISQPDLGTGMITLLASLSVLWFVGMEKKIYLLFGSASAVLVATLKSVLQPYQWDRIMAYINALLGQSVDPAGSGYHARESLIAIGSGGLFGKGYMAGTQHKLRFVPEHHTDFIFTVFAEEWGFVGSVILILAFISLAARCIRIAQNAKDDLGSIIALGLTSLIFFQFTINILMTVRYAPVVGITLPFFSYGGSSLVTMVASVGCILSVAQRKRML